MNTYKIAFSGLALITGIVAAFFISTPNFAASQSIRLCNVSEAKVVIGDDSATTILTRGSYQWVIVQQPFNATNTVSLSFGEAAVSGEGYKLGKAATTSISTNQLLQPEEFKFGHAMGVPINEYVSAKTNSGSTTVNVVSCK